jgi:hypothetical protein
MKLMNLYPLCFAAILVLLAATVSSASAQVLAVTCPGTEGATYSPGITNTPQQSTVTATQVIGPCIGTGVGSVVWGTANLSGVATRSCSANLQSSVTAGSIQWSDGSSSSFHTTSEVVTRPAGQTIILETNAIDSGTFAGATMTWTLTLSDISTACSTSQGITALAGPVTATFTRL